MFCGPETVDVSRGKAFSCEAFSYDFYSLSPVNNELCPPCADARETV